MSWKTKKDRTPKEKVAGAIEVAVADLLYYNRKNDEELRQGDIEDWIESGEVTLTEITEMFMLEIQDAVLVQ